MAVSAGAILRTGISFSLSSLNWAFLRHLQTARHLSVLWDGCILLHVRVSWLEFGSIMGVGHLAQGSSKKSKGEIWRAFIGKRKLSWVDTALILSGNAGAFMTFVSQDCYKLMTLL